MTTKHEISNLFASITETLQPVAEGRIARAARSAAADQKRIARAAKLCAQIASGKHFVKRYDSKDKATRKLIDSECACAPGTFVKLAIKAVKNGATGEQLVETKLAARFEWNKVRDVIFAAATVAELKPAQTQALTLGFGLIEVEDKVVASESTDDEQPVAEPVAEPAVETSAFTGEPFPLAPTSRKAARRAAKRAA